MTPTHIIHIVSICRHEGGWHYEGQEVISIPLTQGLTLRVSVHSLCIISMRVKSKSLNPITALKDNSVITYSHCFGYEWLMWTIFFKSVQYWARLLEPLLPWTGCNGSPMAPLLPLRGNSSPSMHILWITPQMSLLLFLPLTGWDC